MRSRNLCQLVGVVVCLCLAGTSWAAQAIIYVDGAATGANDGSSWTDAYVSLQDALTAAQEADKPLEIRVAQGAYTPDPPTPFQLLNGVTLKGGYVGVAGSDPNDRDATCYATILSADLRNGDRSDFPSWLENTCQVITGNLTDPTAVVDGLTVIPAERRAGVSIRRGSPTLIDCRFVGSNGRPAIDARDCNSILIGCRFEDNEDRAIHCHSGHLTLRDCTFVKNDSYEAILSHGGLDLLRCSFVGNRGKVSCSKTLIARACTFVGNVCYGEVVSCGGASTFMDCCFINNRATFLGPGALRVSGASATVTRCLFAGNAASKFDPFRGGAIENHAYAMRLSHCVFAGNSGGACTPGAIFNAGQILRVSNCTFADNRGQPNTLMYGLLSGTTVELTQSIVWDGAEPFARMYDSGPQFSVTYSNVQGGYAGEGNFDTDPCFVAPGHWDPNGTPDDPSDDVWVMGDYHLKSQAGHWDRASESWVFDQVTSPCIDAGDPNGPLGSEPFPNGGYVNLGAYGGTAEASRSYFGAPVCETQIAGDINGDCKVDDLDLDILMSHWLMEATTPVNLPPEIRIISPTDGAGLTYPIPIFLRVDASDPDGIIVYVEYTVLYDDGHTFSRAGRTIGDSTDGWAHTFDWSRVGCDGTYQIWAEAIDDDGAIAVSPAITVTLHPADQE